MQALMQWVVERGIPRWRLRALMREVRLLLEEVIEAVVLREDDANQILDTHGRLLQRAA
jgi:hypothetical protein